MTESGNQGPAQVVSLHSRAGYQPDMAVIARSHIATARQRLGMTPAEFAEVLGSVLGWVVTPGVVEQWETRSTPPGDALIAAGVLSRAAPVRTDEPADDDLLRQLLGGRFADVEAVFVSRSEFLAQVPPHKLFDDATSIDAAGLSLNLLCQQFPDDKLRSLIAGGTQVRCAFLTPWRQAVAQREHEEGYPPGQLSSLTEMNMQILTQRVHQRLEHEHQGRLQIRTYDETIRFNIMIVDHALAVIQPYLPSQRGIESPTFLLRSRTPRTGLFFVFEQTFDWIWERTSSPA